MRYVALLRGINVGGKNKVPMADLKRVFEEVGHTEVKTYINSGNVIFDAPRGKTGDLAIRLEAEIAKEFGLPLRVLVITGSAVTKIATGLPEAWTHGDESSCNVLYLLPERASPKVLEQFDLNPKHEEMIYVAGAILSRVDRSYMNRSQFHKITGTDLYKYVTVRNANTARRLAALVA